MLLILNEKGEFLWALGASLMELSCVDVLKLDRR